MVPCRCESCVETSQYPRSTPEQLIIDGAPESHIALTIRSLESKMAKRSKNHALESAHNTRSTVGAPVEARKGHSFQLRGAVGVRPPVSASSCVCCGTWRALNNLSDFLQHACSGGWKSNNCVVACQSLAVSAYPRLHSKLSLYPLLRTRQEIQHSFIERLRLIDIDGMSSIWYHNLFGARDLLRHVS